MRVCLFSGLCCWTVGCLPVWGASVEIIGHRGAAYVAPENTLVSVETAWKLGADAAEVDVYLTKDNRIVAIHDETTKRTAGVDLKIVDTDAETLRKLDFGRHKGEPFAGEKIPFLQEILPTVPHGKKLYIEIKCGKEILPLLQKMLASSGKMNQIVIIAFDLDVAAASKQRMPNIPTYWLKGTEKDKETKEVFPHSPELIQPVLDKKLDGLDVNYEGVRKDFADAVKAAGLKLYVWTVNDPDEAKRLVSLGVDGITTDRPGWLSKQLREEKE